MNKTPIALIFLIPGFLLIAAPLIAYPYGFYTFLRLTISISAGFIIYLRSKHSSHSLTKLSYGLS